MTERARRWGKEHPWAQKGCGLAQGERKKAQARARFFWARLQAGKLTGAAADQVRRQYHQWFAEFALES